ncbi:YqgE/AlgH family protein [uncultured Dietzia sp.]|uniref:YqgE/AlgH family protein n=1 Tax=uncultured Dietzia sp. TaxID=395519 RepID=UPI0025E2398A|nr:YqgE/AlgH family protein [uncultured Dietzia sp.]
MDTGPDDLGGGGLFGDRLYDALDKRDPMAGSLLIAAPDMPDPNFRRAIIYVIEHDHSGSLGVVITRASETDVETILPGWADLCAAPPVFHVGGPVKPDTGIALVVLSAGVDLSRNPGLQQIEGRVHVVDLDSDPDLLRDRIDGMRVFVGYTGWAPGQLQDELDRGDWYVAPSLPSDLLAPARVDVWGVVLRRQDMPLPLYATYVDDGDVN